MKVIWTTFIGVRRESTRIYAIRTDGTQEWHVCNYCRNTRPFEPFPAAPVQLSLRAWHGNRRIKAPQMQRIHLRWCVLCIHLTTCTHTVRFQSLQSIVTIVTELLFENQLTDNLPRPVMAITLCQRLYVNRITWFAHFNARFWLENLNRKRIYGIW